MPDRPAATPEVLAATPTLFTDDGGFDGPGNAALLAGLTGRVDGVFVAGTTGEFPALEHDERLALVRLALAAFGPEGVVVHVGAASTREAARLATAATALGARRLAVLTPYYLPVDAGAVAEHFAAVAAAAGDAEVYAYLFPERSGVRLSPADAATVARSVGLAGAKLSGAASDDLAALHAAAPQLRLWSGSDTGLAAAVRGGGAGIVSGLSSVLPEPFTDLARALAEGDVVAEVAAQQRADAVQAALGGTVHGIKAALARLGRGGARMRMPAPRLSAEALAAIAAQVGVSVGA